MLLEQDRKNIESLLAAKGEKNTLTLYQLKGKIDHSLEKLYDHFLTWFDNLS